MRARDSSTTPGAFCTAHHASHASSVVAAARGYVNVMRGIQAAFQIYQLILHIIRAVSSPRPPPQPTNGVTLVRRCRSYLGRRHSAVPGPSTRAVPVTEWRSFDTVFHSRPIALLLRVSACAVRAVAAAEQSRVALEPTTQRRPLQVVQGYARKSSATMRCIGSVIS